MSMTTESIALPAPPRSWAVRRRGLPLLPIAILTIITLTAIFADFLAPHNPEVGSLTARFRPPFWQVHGIRIIYWALTNWGATCCRG